MFREAILAGDSNPEGLVAECIVYGCSSVILLDIHDNVTTIVLQVLLHTKSRVVNSNRVLYQGM